MRSAPQSTGRKGGLAVSDGFASLISGIGTSADKNIANRYGFDARFLASHTDCEAAYRTSWVVRKAHDLPPFDMTRKWRNWQADADQIEKIEEEERRLGLRAKTRLALFYGRLYGGGALILGTNDADSSLPLKPETVAQGGLQFIHAVSRWQISYTEIDRNPLSTTFGQPTMWQMAGEGVSVNIHPSRVIAFIGQPTVGMQSAMDQFWGDPLMVSIWDAVTNADLVQAGIAALVQEAKTDTLKVPNFMSNIGTAEYEARFLRRVEVANQAKSIMRTRLIDKDEEWDTQQVNFAGLPDVERQKLQLVAAACDIPVTRFLGEAPKGLNATGQGDEDNYNAMIAAKQENEARPTLSPLDEVLIRSALGARPPAVGYTWAPLADAEPKEAAEIEKLEAETIDLYQKSGLIPIEALAKTAQNRMVESGRFPGLDAKLKEADDGLDIPALEGGDEPEDPSALTQSPAGQRQAANDAAPRTLYVSRKLLNADEFIRWAKGQGFTTTQKAEDMHVTVCFSRQAVDWMEMGTDWSGDNEGNLRVPAGGPRVIERLGEGGKAVTLAFVNESLTWRHERFVKAGASWDWPAYQPHVTITWDAGDLDLSKVEPYTGPLVFGPEIFAEVKEDWAKSISEA